VDLCSIAWINFSEPGAVAKKLLIILITQPFLVLLTIPARESMVFFRAAVVGLVFGTIYSFTNSIWLLIFAHIAFDLTALAMIYWNVEIDIAHLIFK
jgi:hypothetical protein